MYKNLSKYSESTLSKFDIIGSYFVNLYYNEFYQKANLLKNNGTYINITEAYKNILSSYLEFIKKPEFFKQVVKGIHAYCISTTKYTTMTHKECIEFIVHEFMPQKLWNSVRETQKNKLFVEIIANCINIYTEKIIAENLSVIIDNHPRKENITILQDIFLNIILLEKDKIYSKFLNPDSANNLISVDIFKSKLTNILNEKKDLITEKNNLMKKFNMLRKLNDKNCSVITNLQKQNKYLSENIKNLENQIENLTNINIKLTNNNTELINSNNELKRKKIINNETATNEMNTNKIMNNNSITNEINTNKSTDKKTIIVDNTKKDLSNKIVEKKVNEIDDDTKYLLAFNKPVEKKNEILEFENNDDYY